MQNLPVDTTTTPTATGAKIIPMFPSRDGIYRMQEARIADVEIYEEEYTSLMEATAEANWEWAAEREAMQIG
jgi:hypothetical protein